MVTRGASSLLLSGGGAMTVARTLLMRPSALARARASLRDCRTQCNLFRTRDVWVPNWEVCAASVCVARACCAERFEKNCNFDSFDACQIALKQQWDMAMSEFVSDLPTPPEFCRFSQPRLFRLVTS
jgi:hypothetical protein